MQTQVETNQSDQLVQCGAYTSPSPGARPDLSPDLLCLHLYLWKSDGKEKKKKVKTTRRSEAYYNTTSYTRRQGGRRMATSTMTERGRLTRSVEMSTLHWYCFSFDIASSLWSWLRPPAQVITRSQWIRSNLYISIKTSR